MRWGTKLHEIVLQRIPLCFKDHLLQESDEFCILDALRKTVLLFCKLLTEVRKVFILSGLTRSILFIFIKKIMRFRGFSYLFLLS